MPKSSAHNAYTLIEILIVISIIGLLMGIGILQYRDYARRQSLTSAARSMVADLRLIQENSLSGMKPASGCSSLNGYRIVVSTASYYYVAVCDNGAGPVEIASTKKTPTPPADTNYTPNGTSVMFKILGQGTDLVNDISITVKQVSTANTQTIGISKGGKITWP